MELTERRTLIVGSIIPWDGAQPEKKGKRRQLKEYQHPPF